MPPMEEELLLVRVRCFVVVMVKEYQAAAVGKKNEPSGRVGKQEKVCHKGTHALP